jgi:hypothetical protein
MHRQHILALDPSVNTCGWALASLASGKPTDEDADYRMGTIRPEGADLLWRAQSLLEQIGETITDGLILHSLVIEWPMFYSSHKGQIAAQQGYTINLAAIAMFVAGRLSVPHNRIFLYTAPKWKGSVPKTKTMIQFINLFGEEVAKQLDDNAIDAAMMLHWHLNLPTK